MFNKNLISKIVSCCIILALPFTGHSQMLGFGNGTYNSGNDFHLNSGEVRYEDKYRAEVHEIINPGSSTVTLDIHSNSRDYLDEFYDQSENPGEFKALIVQMIKGSGNVNVEVGNHEAMNIVSVNQFGMDYEIEVAGPLSNIYEARGDHADARLQVILVRQYEKFVLDGGFLTCSSWDGSTGGILAMYVSNEFVINSGKVSVSGKGYFPEGPVLGLPGIGGEGNVDFGEGSETDGHDAGDGNGHSGEECTPCLKGGPSSLGFEGGTGDDCPDPSCDGQPGSQNTGPQPPLHGTSNIQEFFIVMGKAGGYDPGSGAGDGGDGGGPGGGGGGSQNQNPGEDGEPGSDGGAGGKAGKGGPGGGIIYIKANRIIVNSGNNPVFFANGNRGGHGGSGKNGSSGGLGGRGGEGSCDGNDIIVSGNSGGSGITGTPSSGGDGGNGGSPGTIWVVPSSTNNHNLNGSHFSVAGGFGGAGGQGGWAFNSPCGPSRDMDINDNCTHDDLENCQNVSSGGGCGSFIKTCDCKKAYTLLAMTKKTNPSGINGYEFLDDSDELVAWYDHSEQLLVGYLDDGCNEYNYHCYVWDNESCNTIFESLVNQNINGANLNFETNDHWHVGVGPFSVSVVQDADYPEENVFAKYNAQYQHIEMYTHTNGLIQCENAPCQVGRNLKGSDGDNGSSAESGNVSTGVPVDPTANAIVPNDPNYIFKTYPVQFLPENEADVLNVNVWPSPASDQLFVSLSPEKRGEIKIEVFDMLGRKFLMINESVEPGNQVLSLNISELPAAVYKLNVKMGEHRSVVSFVKSE